jgi:hypothetical protein
MPDTPVCRTTRSSPGCGHPTTDHDGNPERECDCCSWAKAVQQLAVGMNRKQRRTLERAQRKVTVNG